MTNCTSDGRDIFQWPAMLFKGEREMDDQLIDSFLLVPMALQMYGAAWPCIGAEYYTVREAPHCYSHFSQCAHVATFTSSLLGRLVSNNNPWRVIIAMFVSTCICKACASREQRHWLRLLARVTRQGLTGTAIILVCPDMRQQSQSRPPYACYHGNAAGIVM